MAHKTFISYKYSEAQNLRDRIIKALGDDASVSIRPRACFFPLFSFLPLWLHYNLNPLCVQY